MSIIDDFGFELNWPGVLAFIGFMFCGAFWFAVLEILWLI